MMGATVTAADTTTTTALLLLLQFFFSPSPFHLQVNVLCLVGGWRLERAGDRGARTSRNAALVARAVCVWS